MSGLGTAFSFARKVAPVALPVLGVLLGVGGKTGFDMVTAPAPTVSAAPSGPIVATLDKDTLAIMRETNRLLRQVANKTVDPVILKCKPGE